MTPSAFQLSAMSRLFSSAVFREMARNGRSSIFARLVGEARIKGFCGPDATVGDAFDAAFKFLRRVGQRDEYIYKAALVRNILLGKHSLNTASLLNEFRAGDSKADLVILNGTATVYEIKSERDSLGRLARQVENYQKVFARIYVIASDDHVDGVINTVPNEVGVVSLNPRFRVSTIRDAIDCADFVCPQAVFNSLRSAEARAILTRLDAKVPDVPNTKMHGAMRQIFAQLQPAVVHNAMVETLKRTRSLVPIGALVDRLPKSLHAAALTIDVRPVDHDRLANAVRAPLDLAMRWA